MEQEREAVEQATRRFYDAIEIMATGGGIEAMSDAWHHTENVTSRHPIDEWSVGWDLVRTTWEIASTVGRPDRGGGALLGMQTHIYGDVAYVTTSYQIAPSWGGDKIMCTNVLLKKDGAWKIIHHHADPSPAMATALEKMTTEG